MGGVEMLNGRYRMVEWLGVGGMSVVWRGHDEVLNRQVAIKVLASRLATDVTFRRRLQAEAQAAAGLSHPHITNVYDYGESPGPDGEPIPFVVMELVDGESMASRLAGDRALGWRAAVTACAQVAAALAVAHAHGVVHRDVTPGNVMLTASGAKVLDFGISALVGEQDADEDGYLFGTPAYLAPERIERGAVSTATDVYALGLLLYRALTGHLPWQAATTTQMLKAHLYTEPAPMPPVAGLPAQVTALCQRCLAKQPADRPTSAQVAQVLTAALGAAPALEPVPGPMAVRAGTDLPREQEPAPAATPPIASRQDAPEHRPPAGHRRLAIVRHPARAALAASGLLLAAALVWAGTSWPSGTTTAQGAPAGSAAGFGPRPGSCAVEYRIDRDTGTTFTADVVIRNTGTEPFPGWELRFDLPGNQRLRDGTQAAWRQDDRTVTARAAEDAVLAPAATARLAFTAGYRASNPLPVTFGVNGTACRAVVIGPAVATAGATGSTSSSDGGGTRRGTGASTHGDTVSNPPGAAGGGEHGSQDAGKGGKSSKSGGDDKKGKEPKGGKND